MKKLMIGVAVSGVMALSVMSAGAVSIIEDVSFGASVNGQNVDLIYDREQSTEDVSVWTLKDYLVGDEQDGYMIQSFTLAADQDPSLSYGLAVIDFGVASVFTFSFASPMMQLNNPTVFSSFSGSVTDGGNGAISITPPVGATVQSAWDHVEGNEWVADGLNFGLAQAWNGQPFQSFSYGPFSGSTVLNGMYDGMMLNVAFTGSGGGDVYTLNGALVKSASVPDGASTSLLLGMAFMALGMIQKSLRRAV